MNHLPLIIKREYLTKVRNKSFIIMTFLSPIIMIALMCVVAYLSQMNNDEVRTISVLDDSGMLLDVFENTDNITYHKLQNMTLEEAQVLVVEAESYGLLHIEKATDIHAVSKHIRFYSESSPSVNVISDLKNKIQAELTNRNRINSGIDIEKLKGSEIEVTILQENFEGEKTSEMEGYVNLAFGVLMGYLLLMFIVIYGNMIMRSVIEEKTSRIIEVIISSVKPIQLMLGKIIGTSLAGVTQFTIWSILLSVLLFIVPFIFGFDMSQMEAPQQQLLEQGMADSSGDFEIQNIIWAVKSLPLINLIFAFLLFFIAGYLLYSSVYAAIGAAVDNETDTQQFMPVVILPLMLAFYVGVFTVIEDPHGTVSTVFSFIPFTSPIVMLMRIPFGVPLWQQLVSLLILIGTFIGTVWFAAKIYRVGILMYGKKASFKEIIKWIKY
ncbi:MAG: ABC transporter permease [Algibacter sp.]